MADEQRNANVELTADVSQYNQQINQANQNTNVLINSVNKLSASLDGISKRAGKKLLLFSAADAAAVTAYTAAAAKYERQLTTLIAQTAVANKGMDTYKKGITDLARQMPITGAQVAALITQINQLGIVSQRETVAMARTFTQLAAATGDDLTSLTRGMIELSRQMGTLGTGAAGMASFADSLTQVSNSAGVSATQVLNFAQSIAPMARAAGMGQKEVLGISAAFTRAGADGYAAANTFNSIISDITRQVMSGSPELAKYAAAIGVTTDEFKRLGATEQLTRIFEAINAAGPQSVRILDRMGIDGIRAAKSIQAVASESGGLRKAIEEATGAYGDGSTARGAAAAFSTMDSQMTKFRNNLEQIAATMGSLVLPIFTEFMKRLNGALDIVNQMAGPLLAVAGALGAVVAPITAAFGGLLTMLGPLSTVMMAMTAFGLSPMRGLFQGIREGRNASMAAAIPGSTYMPTTMAGKRMAPGGGGLKAYQRGPYNLGNWLGSKLPVNTTGGPNGISQMILRGGIGATGLVNSWYIDPTKQLIANAAKRDPFARQSSLGDMTDRAWNARGSIWGTIKQAVINPYGTLLARGGPIAPTGPVWDKDAAERQATQAARAAQTAAARQGASQLHVMAAGRNAFDRSMEEQVKAFRATTNEATQLGRAAASTTKTFGQFSSAMLRTMGNAATIPLSYGSMGVRLGGRAALRGVGGLFSMLGGMVGASGSAALPVGIGLAAVGGAAYGFKQTHDAEAEALVTNETMTNLGHINTALGLATDTLGKFAKATNDGTRSAESIANAAQGLKLTIDEQMYALRNPTQYSDTRVQALTGQDSGVAYLMSLGQLNGQQARAASMDLYRRFGPDADKIIAAYQQQNNNPLAQSMTQIGSGLFGVAENATNQGLVGGLRNNVLLGNIGQMFGSDSTTLDMVAAAVAAAREQGGLVGQKYGSAAGSAKTASNYIDLFNSVGMDNSAGSREVLKQLVKNFEQQYGELGLYTGGDGSLYRSAGDLNSLNPQSLIEWIVSGQNDSAGAKGFRQSLLGTGLSATDFIGPNAKNASQLAIALQRGSLSDYEKQVRGTGLGRFARGNADILSVTDGTSEQNPTAWGKALRAMVMGMTNAGESFQNVTKKANDLARNVGNTDDPLYQLAMAAKQIAYTMGEQRARERGGELGGVRYRLGQISQEINNPLTNDSGLVNLESERVANDERIRSYEQYVYSFQKSTERSWADFNRQMMLSTQEFGISMERNMEDIAKSIYSPFQRTFNPGSVSTQTIITNMKDGQARIEEQMKNLRKLRKMGLQQDTIDQLQLTDPNNAWQVQRLASDAATPGGRKQLQEINKLSDQRDTLAKKDADTWQTTKRTYEDFARSQKLASDAFSISMNRAIEDFKDYNREFNGETEQVVKHTKDMLTKMGLATSPYLERLKAELDAITSTPTAPTNPDSATTKKLQEAQGYMGNPYPGGYQNPANSGYSTNTAPGWQNAYQMGSDWYARTSGTHKNSPLKLPGVWNDWEMRSDQGAMQNWWTNNVVLPGLAKGGIVNKPTMAVIGEGVGPEMVAPLGGVEGRAFIAQMATQLTTQMMRTVATAGHGSAMHYSGGSWTINNNTNWGGVKVYAANMDDFKRQMKEEERRTRARQGAAA